MSKILVIDDSQLVSQLLQSALTEAGYDVAVAFDADQGYRTAIEIQPDLILLDVQLPDVMGFELLNVIRNNAALQAVPVIMVTGSHHQVEHKVRGFQTGANDYILKPFEIPELLERIKVQLKKNAPAPLSSFPGVASGESIANVTPDPSRESLETRNDGAPKALPLGQAILHILLNPLHFPHAAPLPAIAMPYLMALVVLVLSGMALAAGEGIKLTVAGLGLLGAWIVLASALVVASSVAGVTCAWRESNRLLALAGLPLLLKAFCALVMSGWTTLSPFYFSGGGPLFWAQAPFWAQRIDLFELWCFGLLWTLLRKRQGSNSLRAASVTLVVWVVFVALCAGLAHLGTAS